MIVMHFKDGTSVTLRAADKVEYDRAPWPGEGQSSPQGHGAVVCKDSEGNEVARFAASEVRGYEITPGRGDS
jgi:hypothetical protein